MVEETTLAASPIGSTFRHGSRRRQSEENIVIQRSIEHSTIDMERVYDATPARVFAAWSSKEALLRWGCPGSGWGSGIESFDFRVGGGERSWFGPHDGDIYVHETRYLDIVLDRRII